MRTERLLSFQALHPYLGVPQSFLGAESDGGTHPSVFTAAPNAWRELVRLCQDLLVRSRTQLMLPDSSDDEGRNGRTDRHTHTHAPDRQTMHTQETYSFETVQMFYFSVCQECSALSDRGVLISEAGSALL